MKYELTCACCPCPQVHGHIVDLANNHTASRVIQFCAKCSSGADRKQMMDEVRKNVVELSKSKYGHFLVQKLINVCTKEELPGRWQGTLPMHAANYAPAWAAAEMVEP